MGIRLDMKVFTPNLLRSLRALRLIKNKTAKDAKSAERIGESLVEYLYKHPLRSLRAWRLIKNKTAKGAKDAEINGNKTWYGSLYPESFAFSAGSAVN